VTVHCHICGTTNVRPSHFQLNDLPFLLVLRFPVRCRYCRLRFHVSVFSILEVRREDKARRACEKHDSHPSQAAAISKHRVKDVS